MHQCICTEEFCSIPNNHCLGAKQTLRLVLQLAMVDFEIEIGIEMEDWTK